MLGLNLGQLCWDTGLFSTLDSGGMGRITCSVVASVPEDAFTDHSGGLWDKWERGEVYEETFFCSCHITSAPACVCEGLCYGSKQDSDISHFG